MDDFSRIRAEIYRQYSECPPGGTISGVLSPLSRTVVEDLFPMGDVQFGPNIWEYQKKPMELGSWVGEAPSAQDFLLFVATVNGGQLLDRCLNTLMNSQTHPQNASILKRKIVIIDQTKDGLPPSYGENAFIYRVKTKHVFSRIMNLMRSEADRLGLGFYLWAHDDAELSDPVVANLVGFVQDVQCKRERWGVVFTNYDILCAFNTEAAKDVGPWDELIKWYSADNDYYRRLTLRSWPLLSLPRGGDLVNHEGSSTKKFAPKDILDGRMTGDWEENHYAHKWGGRSGHERYSIPYDSRP